MSVEKNIQLNRSSRRVLLIALGVITVVGLYRWILGPYTGQLLAAQRYESTLDGALRKTNFLNETIEAKKGKIKELREESDRLKNELFTRDEVRGFFASLSTMAHQCGCAIQSVRAMPEERGGPQNSAGITPKKTSVTVVGGYNDIIRFLDKLQSSQRRVWIESMRIDIGGSAGRLKCQVVLTLYCIERMEISLYE